RTHLLPNLFILLALALLALALAACQPAPPGTPIPLVRILNFGQPVSDHLWSPHDSNTWQFIAQAGNFIQAQVVSGNVSLVLHDAAGATLGQGQDIQTTIPADGIYSLEVGGSPGDYTLRLDYGTPTLTPTESPIASTRRPSRTATPTITPTRT